MGSKETEKGSFVGRPRLPSSARAPGGLTWWNLFAAVILTPVLLSLSGGCGSQTEVALGQKAAIAGTNGLRARNGLRTRSDLTPAVGLDQATTAGAGSSLMDTEDGRTQMAYLVTCALPATSTIVKKDSQGNSYSFPGLLALAPEWESGACDQNCQEWVSACILSLVNTTGMHVPVWMLAEHPAIGWGQDPGYQKQEGSFFGNLFLVTPEAYYCGGRDFGAPIAGRIGSPEADPSYLNIYGSGGLCSEHCTASDYPYVNDGFKACSGWNHVITIYHQ